MALTAFCLCFGASASRADDSDGTRVFGPQTFVRTTGKPNSYTVNFNVPSWLVAPFTMHIVNGDDNGQERVSSATVSLNGTQVLGPSDLNQNIAAVDRPVSPVTGSNTLQVTLASKPGSEITITIQGTNADHSPPQVTIVAPANGSYINTATPRIEVTFTKTQDSDGHGHSDCDETTLKVMLDGVDRTSLFTIRNGDATATIPSNLALSPGLHTLVATLYDHAHNQGTATSQFTVDLAKPAIQILQPAVGVYLNTPTPTISIQYSDNNGLNLSTLKVLVNGTDLTSVFTKTNTGATATLPASNGLVPGANQIVAQIQDLAGNQASASTSFNIDTTSPTISFGHPTPNSYHGSATVEVLVQYSDDQAIDTSKLQVTLDGTSVTTTKTAVSASGTVANVSNGAHVLAATIADLAGNIASTQISFYVDTSVPTIHVDQPAPNAILGTATPQVTIDYSDVLGVDTSTLKVFVNGLDATALFTTTASSATAQLTNAFALPDGSNTINAQIANHAGTLGTATSNFVVDTTAPTIVIQAPPARTNSNTPVVTISYSDASSGVDPFTLVVKLDGADVSTLVAPGSSSATGVLQLNPPLTDGAHQLSATVKDRAGNQSKPTSLTFDVDTKPPSISFATPTDNSFIHNPTPTITLQYGDGTGTGIDTSSVEIFLQQGTNPPADITSYFQLGPQQATGTIPNAIALSDSTYVLSAVVNDLVGNPANARATFVVDTVVPTGTIQAPAANAILNSASVPVTLVYQDDRSGVDTSKVVLIVDGVNQTSVLTFTPTQATGTLPPLSDGQHTIQLTVLDRSGNSSDAVSQTFTTDTSAPSLLASVVPAPNSAGWINNNVTVMFTCSDSGSGVSTCPPPIAVATEGVNQSFCGQAVDAAGNTSAPACATVNLDRSPPVISSTVSPSPNASGIITTTPVTIHFTCSDSLSGVASCPQPITVTTTGMSQVFSGTAIDVAGNYATTTVTLNIQTVAPTPPAIVAAISPVPNAKGWNNSNPTVTFSCSPGTNPLSICPSPVVVTAEGANQSICGKAIDSAGLSSTACVTINLDKTPPTITIALSPSPSSNGWNTTPVTATFTCSDLLSGIATCPPPQVIGTDGAQQVINGTATDNAGNSSSAQVTLNIDQTPPSILQFTAPTQLAPGQSGTATVTATDNMGITSVQIQLNGSAIATLTAPPYTTTFTVPTTANAGDTLTLTAVVSDIAGNANTSARGVQVVPSGVVTGQVLSDVTSLPFAGATVQIIGGSNQDTSDNSGHYSIPSNSPHLFLSVASPGNPSTGVPATTTVEREVFLQSGVGTVPLDARLTPIAAAIPINTNGGSLVNGSITVAILAGAVSSPTNFHLTSLSQQGLPSLLPLGWSPVAAFDLRADTSTSATFTSNFTQLPNSLTLHLVRYDFNSHTWLMVTPNLGAVNNSLTIPIPFVGDFALVIADVGNSALSAPSAGQPLSGVAMVALPPGAASSGSLDPPSVSPTGGTSLATLSVQSSVPLPSGTVIQANVQETYSLASGKQLSAARRTEDILLYQYSAPNGAAAAASLPVTASQTFQPEQLSMGNVHLDILSGRESVRGQVGGSDAASVTSGDATLSVAAGSLPVDTAIAVAPESVESFLPSTTSLVPLAEFNIDFSGQVLNSPAQLSVSAGSAQSGDTVFLAQVQRLNGAPYLVVVSLGQVNGTSLVTQAVPGLPGITQGGDYVFYKVTSPTGYASGTVTAATGPIAAIVQTDGLPFVAFSSFSGTYLIPALAGAVNLTATVPNTSLAGTNSVQVFAGQTVTANLSVVGQIESATVTPPNGAVGVPLTAEIDISAPDPFNAASVTATNITLTQNGQGTSTPVPVRFVFSQGGARLSVFPQSALQPSTTYTLAASGIANLLGGLIAVPTVTFTTQANTPPNFNTDALAFGMPDQNGNVQVSAPANSFPAGTTILIVDQTNGVVLSLTVGNDGSVSGEFPATIDDVLSVTITAPDKTTTTFTRSQFVAPDGTTAVGPGGGAVVGPGNTGLIIPQGALTKGTTFKLTPLDQSAFPQLPTWSGLNFGSGLHVQAPSMPVFNKEVKLAFPVPAGAPKNAFFYVLRRITDQNGKVYFDTVDHAFIQGTGSSAQVVTASPPFCGYRNSVGNFNIAAAASFTGTVQFSPFQDFILMFDILQTDPNLPGVASPGLVVGKVTQIVPPTAGQTLTTFVPVAGAIVQLTDSPSSVAITSDSCGTFTIFDPQFGGGSRKISATYNGLTIPTTVLEVNGAQADDATYAVYQGLEAQYRNIGRVNFEFPAAIPPPPPPQINITVTTAADGQPIGGIIQTATPLNITLSSTLVVTGATINGATYAVTQTAPKTISNPFATYRLSDPNFPYTPNSPGLYTLTAKATDPLNPSAALATSSRSFLVVQAGGDNTTFVACNANNQSCNAPTVISSSPKNADTGVSPTVFPEIVFSGPVKNIPGNVVLTDHTGTPVPVLLIGVKVPATSGATPVIVKPVGNTDVITSLTIEPLLGLAYNETYTLKVNAASTDGCVDSNNHAIAQPIGSSLIVDQNQPPLCVVPLTGTSGGPYTFTTFGPQELGGTSSQYQVNTRPVVIGRRAYVGEYLNSALSAVGLFDISDPSKPVDLGPQANFIGRSLDTAGQGNSPVTGSGLIAMAAGTAVDNAIPGNVFLYQVPGSDSCQPNPQTPNASGQAPPGCPAPVRVGAVSVTTSATQDGIPLRLFMKDQFLYSSTLYHGLQVIDLAQAVAEYQQVFSTNPTQFGQAISTEGNGFAMDTVVNTIPLPVISGGTATMFDLKADDFPTDQSGTQTLVAATGQLPFVLADPTQSGSAAVLYPSSSGGQFANNPVQPLLMTSSDGATNSLLCLGHAVALGTVTGADNTGTPVTNHLAVVVGTGYSGPAATVTACPSTTVPSPVPAVSMLAVVDLTQAYSPGATQACDSRATKGSPNCPKPIGFVALKDQNGNPVQGTDVQINGTIALVATGTNIILVNLENPSSPTLAGQITGTFGNWINVDSSGSIVGASNSAPSGIQISSLGVVPQISVDPTGLLATPDGKTSQDIPINYAISGDLSQVASAQVQVIDDTGNVVYSTPVPVQSSGSVTWTAGQQIHVTPGTISFQVQNPDGGNSDFVAATPENTFGTAPTPVILSTTPNSIAVGSPQQTIDIVGRNFLVSTQAQFIPSGSNAGDATKMLPVQFISSTEVKLTLSPDYFANLGDASLFFLNGSSLSNEYTMHIIPAGLPGVPTLASISPAQLPLTDGSQDTVITLTGTNFVAGDTIAKIAGEDPNAAPELTTQVTSPTTIQVTIPAVWQTSPTQTALYVQSSTYPVLVSQSLDFEIGDRSTFTQIFDSGSVAPQTFDLADMITDVVPSRPTPAPPVLMSVGDGLVPLAASDATQPTPVNLQGVGFQAGNTVVVDVDGVRTPLSPASVSDSQVQVQLPAPLFKLRTYTFDFQVNLQNANPAQHPPHAQQHNNTGKMVFKDLPLYSAVGPNFHLGGFHSRITNAAGPRDYYLMVPEQSSCAPPSAPPCSNKAVAVLSAQGGLPAGTKISFDQDSPALLDRAPATSQTTVTTVTATGKNENQDGIQVTNIVANKNVTLNGQTQKTPVGKLQAQLIKHHRYAVYLHFISETLVPANPNTPCTSLPLVPASMPVTQALYDQRVSMIEKGLNHIWNQQANVQFDVFPAQGAAGTCDGEVIPQQVHYDLNNDSNLKIKPRPNTEIDAVTNAFPNPALPQGYDDQMHVYFVKSFLNKLALVDAHIPNNLKIGSPYAMSLTFDGGVGPYAYQLQGGPLPPGLNPIFPANNNSKNVVISGTPQAAGAGNNYQATVLVTDSAQPATTIGITITFKINALPNSSPKPKLSAAPNLPDPTQCCTLGFVTKIGGRTVLMDDRTTVPMTVHVLAHELGHALKMNHISESDGITTCVPNLAQNDSDFSDHSQLMWWNYEEPKKRQSHIGIQQLWQMNGNLLSLCAP